MNFMLSHFRSSFHESVGDLMIARWVMRQKEMVVVSLKLPKKTFPTRRVQSV